MTDVKRAISEALTSDSRLTREMVREWLRGANDLETLALLYRLTDEAWHRIDPHVELEETCSLIQTYLLQCIREDPQDDWALTRYEAAWQLEAWFDHIASLPADTRAILRDAEAAIN